LEKNKDLRRFKTVNCAKYFNIRTSNRGIEDKCGAVVFVFSTRVIKVIKQRRIKWEGD
jgi:hypothetical protein